MAKMLSSAEQDRKAEQIEYSLINYKGNRSKSDIYKQVASKCRVDIGFVMHIVKSRNIKIGSAIKEEKEVAETKRKSYTHMTNDQIDQAMTMVHHGVPLDEIAKEYDVCVGTIRRHMKQFNVKAPSNVHICTDEEKIEIADKYIAGADVNELAVMFETSCYMVNKIIGELCTKEDIELSKLNRKARRALKQVVISLDDTISNSMQEKKVEEKKSTSSAVLYFANNGFKDPLLRECEKPGPIDVPAITVGMIGERHDLPIDECIFPDTLSNDKKFNFSYQEKYVDNWIKQHITFDSRKNATKALRVLCTGYQPVFGSIMRSCLKNKVNLIASHYIRDDEPYLDQVIIDQFGDMFEEYNKHPQGYPFDLVKSKLYLYDCSLEDVTGNENLYIIALNKHDDVELTTMLSESFCLILNKEEHIWRLFTEFAKIIDKNRNRELNSIKLCRLSTTRNSYEIGDMLAKSFNFRR